MTLTLARLSITAAVLAAAGAAALGGATNPPPASVQPVASDRPTLLQQLMTHDGWGTGVSCFESEDLAACLMPGASLRDTHGVNQHMQQVALKTQGAEGGAAYYLGPRWSPQVQGEPITIRWSIVPLNLQIPGSGSVGEPAGPNTWQTVMTNVFGSVENALVRYRLVFDRWEQLSGIDFMEVSDDGAVWGAPGPINGGANRGDIRIGMHPFGASSVLAYTGFPNGGDIVMNGSTNWNQPFNNFRFLRNVIAHEVGHGIGLRHNCPQNESKLMEPTITLDFDGPQHDDTRAGMRHYGDTMENNNTTATSTVLGSITSSVTENLSLDDDSDIDFFSFTVVAGQQADIRVFPVGFSYLDAEQSFDDTCPAGTLLNSLAILDMRLRLINTNGVTVLITEDINGAGLPERILDFPLPTAGTYFIRVSGMGADDIQTYRLLVDIEPVPPPQCPEDLNDNGSVDGVDLGILLSGWGVDGPADLNNDNVVNGVDLGILLAAWGSC